MCKCDSCVHTCWPLVQCCACCCFGYKCYSVMTVFNTYWPLTYYHTCCSFWYKCSSAMTMSISDSVSCIMELLVHEELFHVMTVFSICWPLIQCHACCSYWYKNGCLFPDMMTVFMSVDPCRKTNGCLQVSKAKAAYPSAAHNLGINC